MGNADKVIEFNCLPDVQYTVLDNGILVYIHAWLYKYFTRVNKSQPYECHTSQQHLSRGHKCKRFFYLWQHKATILAACQIPIQSHTVIMVFDYISVYTHKIDFELNISSHMNSNDHRHTYTCNLVPMYNSYLQNTVHHPKNTLSGYRKTGYLYNFSLNAYLYTHVYCMWLLCRV